MTTVCSLCLGKGLIPEENPPRKDTRYHRCACQAGAPDAPEKIVAEFEDIFGRLTATERRWLTRRIAGQEV